MWLQGPRAGRARGSVGRPPTRAGAGRPSRPAGAPLRVAMLAPPWISVPPPGYGGVESVVGVLTDALVRRGHAVTLFCAPGSRSSARVVPLLEEAHPEEIERSLYEVDHVARAFEEIDLAAYDGASTWFTITAASPRSPWPTASRRRSCIPCTGSSPPAPRPSTPATATRRRSSASAGRSSRPRRRAGPGGRDPEPHRRAGLAAARAQGRLPAVDRQDDGREGPSPRDRRRPCRGRAARPGGSHPARPAGVLRPRGRAAHRRRARPLRRRGRWVGQASRCSRAPARC